MTVTFFGHRDMPKEIEPTLRKTLTALIENYNITEFYVGNNGNFGGAWQFKAFGEKQGKSIIELNDRL